MSSLSLLRGATLAAFALFAGTASAAVDQENLPGLTFLNSQAPFITWQQEVVAGTAGLLTGVDLWAFEAPGSFRVFINRGTGWQTDSDDFSVVLTPPASSQISIDLSTAGLTFAAGEAFVIGIQGQGPGTDCCGLVASMGEVGYDAGNLYTGEGLIGDVYDVQGQAVDLSFRTHVGAVPEPETYALMLLGLAGLGAVARRRSSRD